MFCLVFFIVFLPPRQDYFARVPGLRMVEFTPTSTRILGDFAVQAGQYTFAWENADGSTTEVLARFNFTFRKEADNWKIIHHHSSAMPAAPDALKPVREVSVVLGDDVACTHSLSPGRP